MEWLVVQDGGNVHLYYRVSYVNVTSLSCVLENGEIIILIANKKTKKKQVFSNTTD